MIQTGRIYKIESDCGSILYIGSTTCNLNDRFYNHKKSKSTSICKYLFDPAYTFSNKCELIKEYKVVDRRHLLAYEQLWINKHKQCINKNPALQLLNKQRIKSKNKKYYENNKESISNKNKNYREINKESISNRMKEYYNANKESISKKMKEYGEVKVLCECGSTVRRGDLARHYKSNKHNDYIYDICKEVLEDIISLI